MVPELCNNQGLPHPVSLRAPVVRTVGLRNPASCDPLRESGDEVFRECFYVITEFIMDVEEFFPNNGDLFLDNSSLYDNMGENTCNANGSSSTFMYVILILLVEIMMLFLFLLFSRIHSITQRVRWHVWFVSFISTHVLSTMFLG
jgi:hypothetical protein